MTTLRDEHKRIARDRIMAALAAEIVERGVLEVSVPAVAARAGVSARTVYNYFESKDGLLAALGPWADEYMERLGGVMTAPGLDELPEAVRINFRTLTEMGDVADALARLSAAVDPGSPLLSRTRELRELRTEAFVAMVVARRPDLDPEHARAVAAAVRVLASFSTWHRMTTELGVDAAVAGEAAAWLVELAVAALEERRSPFD